MAWAVLSEFCSLLLAMTKLITHSEGRASLPGDQEAFGAHSGTRDLSDGLLTCKLLAFDVMLRITFLHVKVLVGTNTYPVWQCLRLCY